MNSYAAVRQEEYALKMCDAVEAFDYPAVTFDSETNREIRHSDMTGVERHIRNQLLSDNLGEVKNGLSNVIYWGFASQNVACARYRVFRERITVDNIRRFAELVGHLRGPGLLDVKRLRMPQFTQMSFVSKLRMFLDPVSYPVLDLQIARFAASNPFPPLEGLKMQKTYIPISKDNERIYHNWAAWCRAIAEQVNEEPTSPCRDLRAVDVERGIFTLIHSDKDGARQILQGPQRGVTQ